MNEHWFVLSQTVQVLIQTQQPIYLDLDLDLDVQHGFLAVPNLGPALDI